jgi:cobaltochelatase CobT
MFRRLWQRSAPQNTPPSSAAVYRAYTTKFDLEVRAERLPKVMGFGDERTFLRYVAEFDRAMTEWRASADLVSIDTVSRIKAAGGFDPKNIVASLLVDHSGSLRGQRAVMAVAIGHSGNCR